jgi:hypothetical protein
MIFSCSSGHVLTANLELAGQKVRCPICREVVEAPRVAAPPPVAILVGPPSASAPPPPLAHPVPPPLPQELKTQGMPVLEITEVLPEEPPAPVAFQDLSTSTALPPIAIPAVSEPAPYSFIPEHASPPAGDNAPRPAKKRAPIKEDDEPQADFRGVERLQQQLRAINLGLYLHYWKYLAVAVSMLFFMSGAIVETFAPLLGVLLIFLSFATGVAAPVLGIMGSIYCNGPIIPADSRSLVLTSLGLDIASLALAVVGALAVLFVPPAGLVLLAVSGLLNLAAFSLFMLFLRKLASYLGDNVLAQRAFNTMVLFLGVTLGGLVTIVLINVIIFIFLGLAFSMTLVILDIVWIILVINALFQILHVIADVRLRVMER